MNKVNGYQGDNDFNRFQRLAEVIHNMRAILLNIIYWPCLYLCGHVAIWAEYRFDIVIAESFVLSFLTFSISIILPLCIALIITDGILFKET